VLTGGAVLLEGMPELAEEILGMPVRTGFPTGVKGITQLVHGPQYATGVGLVKYGASAMAEALAREAAPAPQPPRAQRASGIIETPEAREKSKFWEWIKLAF
jgi:cell division protein FtsA